MDTYLEKCLMTIVNFYDKTPSAEQLYTDMQNDELAVFDHFPTGARELHEAVEALGSVHCSLHQENSIRPWEGEDYFVLAPGSFDYMSERETLRRLALNWINTGRGDIVTSI